MNTIRMTEQFGASTIHYVPNSKGWIDAFIDNEPKPLISGDCIDTVRKSVFARIRREARPNND